MEILGQSNVANFPLDWTKFATLPQPTSAGLSSRNDITYGGLGVDIDQMTHIVPTGSQSVSNTILQQINALNSIWKQTVLIRIGLNSNVDITRLFIMLEEADGTTPPKRILATMPGQNFTKDITNDEFAAFTWYQEALADTNKLVFIHKQADPFNGGIQFAIGYCMGFRVGTLRGVVGVQFNTIQMERLILPLFYRGRALIHVYIYNSQSTLVMYQDTARIMDKSPAIKNEMLTSSIVAK